MRNSVERFGLAAMLAVLLCVNFCSAVSLPLVRTIPVPDACGGITFVGDDLWVWRSSTPSTFLVLDPVTGETRRTLSAPDNFGATTLAYDGQSVWGAFGGIYNWEMFGKFNATDGSLISEYSLPIPHPTGLTFDGTNLWVSQISDHSLVKVDPQTLNVLDTLYKAPRLTHGLAWDGAWLWMAGDEKIVTGDGIEYLYYLYRIDPKDGSIVDTYDGPTGGPGGMVFRDGQLFVSSWFDQQIYVYQVPEPASGIYILGASALACVRKRRAS